MLSYKLPQQRLMLVWLTQEESEDDSVRAKLQPLYTASKERGWKTVVFHSGSQDLFTNTKDLLLANRA